MELNHLHLEVTDLDRAVAFWTTHFGFVVDRRFEDVQFLRDAAGFDLALAETSAPAPLPAPQHVGFRLHSVLEVERLHDRLARAGAPLVEPLSAEADLVWFRTRDPDAHLIEVYWERGVD